MQNALNDCQWQVTFWTFISILSISSQYLSNGKYPCLVSTQISELKCWILPMAIKYICLTIGILNTATSADTSSLVQVLLSFFFKWEVTFALVICKTEDGFSQHLKVWPSFLNCHSVSQRLVHLSIPSHVISPMCQLFWVVQYTLAKELCLYFKSCFISSILFSVYSESACKLQFSLYDNDMSYFIEVWPLSIMIIDLDS